jgi:tricorn protease
MINKRSTMKFLRTTLLLFVTTPVWADPLLLQPEVSPDGSHIAFSYQGDIWSVPIEGGRADRLTIHEGYDGRPVWTPDSEKIAFQSDRFGNDHVIIMSASGGLPQRLTYHSAPDRVLSITPAGQVLFNSRRLYAQVEREWEVLAVEPDTSRTESRYMDALGFDAVVSPDGKKVAFVRGTVRTAREAYLGPANRDIWVFDRESGEYTQLTDFEGNDFLPRWADDQSLFFISARSGKYNVHRLALDGSVTPVTQEQSFGVEHFSVSADGAHLIYQAADAVFHHVIADGSTRRLTIDVGSDRRFDAVVAKKVSNDIEQYAVSPNGELAAYVLRGDLYVMRTNEDDNKAVRLTEGAARDRDVTWLDDNTLLFVSDRAGQNDLYRLSSADAETANLFVTLKHQIQRVTETSEEEFGPVVAPDGKRVAFRQGRGRLLTARISDDGKLRDLEVLLDGWDTPAGISWSPDSRWLAYSLSDLTFNEEVYIHAADNSQPPVNVSMHPKRDSNPVWSPDGSKLGFISYRNNSDADVWFAWLKAEDWRRSEQEWERIALLESLAKDVKEDAGKEADKEPDGKSDELEPITIDFDGLYQRLTQVTAFATNESELVFTADGDSLYYTVGGSGRQNFKADRGLFKIDRDGEGRKTIIAGDVEAEQLALGAKGEQVYVLTKGGKLNRVAVDKDEAKVLAVNSPTRNYYVEELELIFDEGWRALEAGFYDPKFHGRDWRELHDKYKPLALSASTKEDFQYVFNLMLGQLDASHMGLRRGDNQKETQKQVTGLLGVEGLHTDAGYEVTAVLTKSPADRAENGIEKGDVITAINEMPLAEHNLYELLSDTADQPTLVSLERKGKAREVVVWPTKSLRDELYDAWVEERRKLTEEYSDGRLGYLHIRGMNWTSFERFERELMAAGYGKEGIVIDVRYNGGGWTTDYLMSVLNVKQHAYTIPRGALDDIQGDRSEFRDTYPFSERLPLAAWTKPSIAMSNENSYSNAEIFSHAYQALGIGKVVGRPTFGAVISTGSYRLVDGSYVRMPFRGWWVKATDKNMEHGPAVPDIEVFNPPAYKARGVDPQLQRAVDELLQQLNKG